MFKKFKNLILIALISFSFANIGLSKTKKTNKKSKKQTVKVKKKTKSTKKTKKVAKIYFKNCKQAYAAGYYNIKRGEPGYSSKLDRDGDGIACERK